MKDSALDLNPAFRNDPGDTLQDLDTVRIFIMGLHMNSLWSRTWLLWTLVLLLRHTIPYISWSHFKKCALIVFLNASHIFLFLVGLTRHWTESLPALSCKKDHAENMQQQRGASMNKKSNEDELFERVRRAHILMDDLSIELDWIVCTLRDDVAALKDPQLPARIKRAFELTEDLSIEFDCIEWKLKNGGKPRVDSSRYDPPPLRQAHKLRVLFEADGTASVYVDDLFPFHVTRVLAFVLQVLAMDTGNRTALYTEDPLVPFKTYEEILSNMTRMFGYRGFTQGALRQAIYRLRKIMAKHNFNGLLQTNRQLGAYRFAVRRETDSTIAPPLLSF